MMKKICNVGSLENSALFSAEAVISNEDLIREIFLRLPLRSLIRFKLVSKHWSTLISDPEFAQDRTRRLNPTSVVPSGLFFYNSHPPVKIRKTVSVSVSLSGHSSVGIPSLSFLISATGGTKSLILQSCNGLLLCQIFRSDYISSYCVCNPTTKKYKILPRVDIEHLSDISGVTLVFDPSLSQHYKVVCLVLAFYSYYSRIEIYSSETGEWTPSAYHADKSDDPPIIGTTPRLEPGFYWNGSIHLIDPLSVKYYPYEYNLEKDDLKEGDMPPSQSSSGALKYFGESQGRLHLVYFRNHSVKKFNIFERDKETLKWSVKYCVKISHMLSEFPEAYYYRRKKGKLQHVFSILSVYNGEKEEDSALILNIPGKVVSYNLLDKTSKVLRKLESQNVYEYSPGFTGFNFVETLASV